MGFFSCCSNAVKSCCNKVYDATSYVFSGDWMPSWLPGAAANTFWNVGGTTGATFAFNLFVMPISGICTLIPIAIVGLTTFIGHVWRNKIDDTARKEIEKLQSIAKKINDAEDITDDEQKLLTSFTSDNNLNFGIYTKEAKKITCLDTFNNAVTTATTVATPLAFDLLASVFADSVLPELDPKTTNDIRAIDVVAILGGLLACIFARKHVANCQQGAQDSMVYSYANAFDMLVRAVTTASAAKNSSSAGENKSAGKTETTSLQIQNGPQSQQLQTITQIWQQRTGGASNLLTEAKAMHIESIQTQTNHNGYNRLLTTSS
jgi:hypothetical protein